MRAVCIVMEDDEQSEAGWQRLHQSHLDVGNDFGLERVDAITPDRVHAFDYIMWTYPWFEPAEVGDLMLLPYQTPQAKHPARIACFLSHYCLWDVVAIRDQPHLILEDDAEFLRRIEPRDVLDNNDSIVGVNDPSGATRRSLAYHQRVQAGTGEVVDVPWVDDKNIPQGLAGNSAYIMTPRGARLALALVKEHGAWPNDALLCKQLLPPGTLGQTRTYYTRVQGTPSRLS